MKQIKIIAGILFFAMFLLSTSSCVVQRKNDSKKKMEWYKVPGKHGHGKGKSWKSPSNKSFGSHSMKPGKAKHKR